MKRLSRSSPRAGGRVKRKAISFRGRDQVKGIDTCSAFQMFIVFLFNLLVQDTRLIKFEASLVGVQDMSAMG